MTHTSSRSSLLATVCLLWGSLTAGACVPAGSTEGLGGDGTGSGGASTGSGGAAIGSGGASTGSGGASTGSGGASTGSGGASTGSGGRTGTGGTTMGSGGATTGSGGASTGSGGRTGTGGTTTGSGGATTGSGGKTSTGGATGSGGAAGGSAGNFSFFVTSLSALQKLSGNTNGFGGDLRYGQADGLTGADKICHDIAEMAVLGSGSKTWHAFLSTVTGPVHAKDRVGAGPWYDAKGRLVASTLAQLLMERPGDANAAIKDDLPNEYGTPNHTDGAPGCTGNACPDNHDTLTGTGPSGSLYKSDMASTCNDWTSAASSGAPWCGHCWPRQGSGLNWMSALAEAGCAPGAFLKEAGPPGMNGTKSVGDGGGYGGFYCFALTP